MGETRNIRAIAILLITWADVFTGLLGKLPKESMLRWHLRTEQCCSSFHLSVPHLCKEISNHMYFDPIKKFKVQVEIVNALMHSHLTHVPSLSPSVGAVGILHAGLIPLLVFKLKTELDEIQELILDTLSNCLRVEASEALATGAITILKEKLKHSSAAIRSKAAWVLLEIG